MGRRLFDVVDGPGGWNEDMGTARIRRGHRHSSSSLTRRRRRSARTRARDALHLVDDLATAVDQARAAATHGDVVIMGGGDVMGQALEQGLVDELRIHLAPMLLGGGTPLFKPGTRQMYRQRDVRPSKNAVHLAYERS